MNREEYLAKYLENYLLRKGLNLSKENYSLLLREFLRYANDPTQEGTLPIPTQDGSFTLINKFYKEPYHSHTAGAVQESLHKFIYPSKILEKAQKKEVIRILDVGFGLGYNVAIALKHLWEVNPKVKVEILSLERELRKDIPLLPKPYTEIHKFILSIIPEYEDKRLKLKIFLGDARREIRKIENFKADAVFHDAFSPYKNPELWTYDFLKLIKEVIDPYGYWVSYTSALCVRKALLLLGFQVGSTKELGRKRKGTVASLKAPVPPLDEEEVRKLHLSPFSIPMRDESLDKEPLEILLDYLVEVYKLK